ncbi:MAG: site-specific integrase [Phycisphaeraceae bacterium]|nr:site-specific integrase [Phycisphaeraceae bacterium]
MNQRLKHWYFAMMVSNGNSRKQQVINTYATDKPVAQEILRKTRLLAEAADAHMPLTTELRQWLNGMDPRLRKKLATLGLINGLDAAAMSDIGQHLDDYLRASQFEGQTEDHVGSKEGRLRTIIADTGAQHLTDLTSEKVTVFLSSLKDKGRSHRTVKLYRGTVVAWLNWCVKQRRIDHHTLDYIPRLNEDVDRRRTRRAATQEEIDKILQVMPPRRRFVFLAAIYTGLRRGEMNKIERRDLDLAAGTMTVRPEVGKTRKPVVLPLHEDVVKMLAEWTMDMKPNDLVFKPVPMVKTLKVDLEKAGVPFKDENGRQLDFHALRSTFTTLLLRQDIPPSVARRLTRHSSVQTLEKHYDMLGLTDAVDAIKRVPGFRKEG